MTLIFSDGDICCHRLPPDGAKCHADRAGWCRLAADLAVTWATAAKWRSRFLEDHLDGLADDRNLKMPRTITREQVELVVAKTLYERGPQPGHLLVDTVDGGRDLHVPDGHLGDLAGIRPQAAPSPDLELSTDPEFIGMVHGLAEAAWPMRDRTGAQITFCSARHGRRPGGPTLVRYRRDCARSP